MLSHPDFFYVVAQGAGESSTDRFIDRPQSCEQNNPDPIRRILVSVKHRSENKHQNNNKYAIDKGRLNPVSKQRIFCLSGVFSDDPSFHGKNYFTSLLELVLAPSPIYKMRTTNPNPPHRFYGRE